MYSFWNWKHKADTVFNQPCTDHQQPAQKEPRKAIIASEILMEKTSRKNPTHIPLTKKRQKNPSKNLTPALQHFAGTTNLKKSEQVIRRRATDPGL